jgi:hypothetical protein
VRLVEDARESRFAPEAGVARVPPTLPTRSLLVQGERVGTIAGARARVAVEIAAARSLTGRPTAVNLLLPPPTRQR